MYTYFIYKQNTVDSRLSSSFIKDRLSNDFYIKDFHVDTNEDGLEYVNMFSLVPKNTELYIDESGVLFFTKERATSTHRFSYHPELVFYYSDAQRMLKAIKTLSQAAKNLGLLIECEDDNSVDIKPEELMSVSLEDVEYAIKAHEDQKTREKDEPTGILHYKLTQKNGKKIKLSFEQIRRYIAKKYVVIDVDDFYGFIGDFSLIPRDVARQVKCKNGFPVKVEFSLNTQDLRKLVVHVPYKMHSKYLENLRYMVDDIAKIFNFDIEEVPFESLNMISDISGSQDEPDNKSDGKMDKDYEEKEPEFEPKNKIKENEYVDQIIKKTSHDIRTLRKED